VVWVTVLLPVLMLLVLCARAVALPGARMGLRAYLQEWDFDRLAQVDIWVDAVTQIFFSLGVGIGVMVTYGSYNKRGSPVVMDSFIIAVCNSSFSLVSGVAVWATLGYQAHLQGFESIQAMEAEGDVSFSSLGLVFMTYPATLSELTGMMI
jgi:SNF family Na+-dependent transporter